MRWLYHVVETSRFHAEAPEHAAESLSREGFIHCSFRGAAAESARLHFAADAELVVLKIDPRRLPARVEVAETPRGPMPHVMGAIPKDAIRAVLSLEEMQNAPDEVAGTRFGFVAFSGMTLLDLVGAWDPVSRIASMGFDRTSVAEIVSADATQVFACEGASLSVTEVRPPLDRFDVLVVPGGFGTRTLVDDVEVMNWLRSFPENRMIASVCTGSLLLGAAGRLKGLRATTHRSAKDDLAQYGATFTDERVVDEGQVITAGGVTSAIDLGLWLVKRISGEATEARIRRQMEVAGPGSAKA